MENKRWRKYLLFFTTDTNNNKIVLICTKKIINDETTNYSDYIFITITITLRLLANTVLMLQIRHTYKATKEYLMSEKNFGGNSSYIFNSLSNADGLPILNVQIIEKVKIS
jgi:hypothetical protein